MKRLQRAMGTQKPRLAQSEVSEKGDGGEAHRSQMGWLGTTGAQSVGRKLSFNNFRFVEKCQGSCRSCPQMCPAPLMSVSSLLGHAHQS